MGIPKKSDSAANQLRSTRTSTATGKASAARTIFANDRSPKEKLTLTMDGALKRQIKVAAAQNDTTISDLVDSWARKWLDTNKK